MSLIKQVLDIRSKLSGGMKVQYSCYIMAWQLIRSSRVTFIFDNINVWPRIPVFVLNLSSRLRSNEIKVSYIDCCYVLTDEIKVSYIDCFYVLTNEIKVSYIDCCYVLTNEIKVSYIDCCYVLTNEIKVS